MSKKVLPILLTDEELLSGLESAPEVEEHTDQILDHNTDVVPFLSHYGITPGEYPVNKRILYRLYKQYYSQDPLPSLNFHHIVGQFLAYYFNRSGGFYKINQDQFKLSAHMFKEHKKKTVDKTKSNTYRRHFETFLVNRNIKPGDKFIEGQIIHDIYKDYCKNELGLRHPKLGRTNFHSFCKLYFKHKRIGDSRAMWYQINKEELDERTT